MSSFLKICGRVGTATYLGDISESVTPMRFELMISWMRTKCPGPLDDGAMRMYYIKYTFIMACYLKTKTLFDVTNQLSHDRKSIILTHGAFDMFHIGHMELLKQSKRLGDYLIVGLDSDERIKKYKSENRPIIPLQQRIEILLEDKSVDFVFSIDDTIDFSNKYFLNLYKNINPNIVTFGRKFGFQDEMAERKRVLNNCQFKQIKHQYDGIQSTTNIIDEVTRRYSAN